MADWRKFTRRSLVAIFLLLLGVERANAHLVTTGLGPVYDGISHFALSPDDLLPAVALALFAGLRGPLPGRRVLFALPLAWLAGGLTSLFIYAPAIFPVPVLAGVLAITILPMGLLVAADLKMPTRAVIALALAIGLIHGYINGMAMTQDGATPATATLQLLGVAATLFVLVALVAAFVLSLRWEWTRIAVRVAGSWTAAIGLLWLGWSLVGRG